MVAAFEQHLRDIVLRAQGATIARLQRRLTMTDGVIDQTAANYSAMRRVGAIFMEEMDRAGYPQLVQAFVGEFKGTLPFLDDILRYLSDQLRVPLPLDRLNVKDPVLTSYQITASDALTAVVEGVAGTAMRRAMFSVGGLKFADLVASLTEKFETSIARARTLADTAMSTFYRTATDRAFQVIEKDLPQQEIKYRYSGPDDKLTRPFCEHLLRLDKGYTREQIDGMSNGQLPNVWLTGGGWNCRHSFVIDTRSLERRAMEAA